MAPPSFRARLIAALRDAVQTLQKEIGKERLMAFALYTSGESDFDYVCVSACTEEGLVRLVDSAKARKRGVERTDEDLEGALRWSACDWEHHDFYEAVGRLKLPSAGDAKRDAKVYADFAKALQTLDAEGLFGKGAARSRLTLAVMCGDMSAEFLLKGVKKLNPPAVVKRYVDENTPARLYAGLDKLPAQERRRAYLDLAEYSNDATGLDRLRSLQPPHPPRPRVRRSSARLPGRHGASRWTAFRVVSQSM